MLSENKGTILNIDAVIFSSSVPVGVKSPLLEGVWPLLVRRVVPPFYRAALHKEDKSWVPLGFRKR